MILPGVNILLHAVNSDSPRNDYIRPWWDSCVRGTTPVCLTWTVLLGFVRISTNPRLFNRPFTIGEAADYVDSLLNQPTIQMISPRAGHWELVASLLKQAGAAGNLTTDAHLAALAIEWQCTLYSTDTDFARFPGVKWRMP